MKRTSTVLAIVLSILLVATGCSNGKITEDIMNYANAQLPPLVVLEETAVYTWASVSGANYIDDETMYNALVETVIPTYTVFLEKLDAIKPATSELKKVHDLYIEGAKDQLEAFHMAQTALEEQDEDLINEANLLLQEGAKKILSWQEELMKLAKENEVSFTE